MDETRLPVPTGKSFEELKRHNPHGAEFWSARDLQLLLGYSQWRRFEQAISRAVTSCEQSGNDPAHHFAGAGKMIELAKGAVREVADFHLSRFACYLIAQNGDPRKPEIALAQSTSRFRLAGRRCRTRLLPTGSASSSGSRILKSSTCFRAQHSRPGYRVERRRFAAFLDSRRSTV